MGREEKERSGTGLSGEGNYLNFDKTQVNWIIIMGDKLYLQID